MKNILEDLFFNKNVARTIEHFLLHEKWEQNQQDLCESINLYPRAMKPILEKLVAFGLIKETRRIAKSRFYKLNEESNLILPLRLLSKNFGYQMALKEGIENIQSEVGIGKKIKMDGGQVND